MKKLCVLLLCVAMLFATPAKPQSGASLNMAVLWSNGGKAGGTASVNYYIYDTNNVPAVYNACAVKFSPSGKASCNAPLKPDTFYAVVLSLTNPNTGQVVTVELPFFIPSWIMPLPVRGASYATTLDVTSNQTMPGSTTVSVTY